MRGNSKARRVAFIGILFALSLVLSMFESAIAAALGLAPGIKPGLANIVVMYAAYFMGAPVAATLVVLKVIFAFLTRGAVAALMSLSGSTCSLLITLVVIKLYGKSERYIPAVSICGAVFHNVGQLLGAWLLLGTPIVLYYFAVLFLSGIAMGILTGALLRATLPALKRV